MRYNTRHNLSGRGAVRFSALAWGARGRRFESSRPDKKGSIFVEPFFCPEMYAMSQVSAFHSEIHL